METKEKTIDKYCLSSSFGLGIAVSGLFLLFYKPIKESTPGLMVATGLLILATSQLIKKSKNQ